MDEFLAFDPLSLDKIAIDYKNSGSITFHADTLQATIGTLDASVKTLNNATLRLLGLGMLVDGQESSRGCSDARSASNPLLCPFWQSIRAPPDLRIPHVANPCITIPFWRSCPLIH